MFARQALDTDITPLFASDTIREAREKKEVLNASTLPVVEKHTRRLIGQINFNSLTRGEQVDEDRLISSFELDEAIKIYPNQHVFEASRLMLQYELRILSVVDEEWKFIGVLYKNTVLESLTHMLNLAEQGSVITIELNERDFTLSEIVHLIESEGAKILGITVEQNQSQKGSFEVSIKVNLKDVTRIASALRRYEYTVMTESGSEAFGRDIESRADELIKYLDI